MNHDDYILREMSDETPGRRARKKKKTKEALEEAALRLFSRKGYDDTTVEDITEAVDVSTRTFFRYFESKEAVLFTDWKAEIDAVVEMILSLPKSEHPLSVMRTVLAASVDRLDSDKGQVIQIKRLARDSAQVGEFERAKIYPAAEEAITEAMATRLEVNPDEDLRPALYSNVALAVMKSVKRQWAKADCQTSLRDLLKEAMDLLDLPSGGTA